MPAGAENFSLIRDQFTFIFCAALGFCPGGGVTNCVLTKGGVAGKPWFPASRPVYFCLLCWHAEAFSPGGEDNMVCADAFSDQRSEIVVFAGKPI